MAGLITVELRQVRFFAHHGLFADERKTGNEFVVDLAVSYEASATLVDDISSTINYAELFEIVKEEMKSPVDLLETLAQQIAAKIKTKHPDIKQIRISIAKLHPPIIAFVGNVAVTFTCDY